MRRSRSCGRQRAAERSVCKNQSGSARSTEPLACSFSARQSCWADPADASCVCVTQRRHQQCGWWEGEAPGLCIKMHCVLFSPHPAAAVTPFLSLCSAGVNSKSARVLFLLVIPGHLVFLYTIHLLQGGHTSLSFTFVMFYLAAALLQVNPKLWSRRNLSDNIKPAFSRLKRSHRKTFSSSLFFLSFQGASTKSYVHSVGPVILHPNCQALVSHIAQFCFRVSEGSGARGGKSSQTPLSCSKCAETHLARKYLVLRCSFLESLSSRYLQAAPVTPARGKWGAESSSQHVSPPIWKPLSHIMVKT